MIMKIMYKIDLHEVSESGTAETCQQLVLYAVGHALG